MRNEQRLLMNILLDKYERSKTFQGDNRVTQSITIKPEKVFSAYLDDSQYEVFTKVNEAIKDLEDRNIVKVIWQRNGVISKLSLNIERLDDGYQICGKTPKKDINQQLNDIWKEFADTVKGEPFAPVLSRYLQDQADRMKSNKTIAYFDGDFQTYGDFLKIMREVYKNDSEQFIRDFSIRVLGNSKRLEMLEDKVRAFICEYGECTEKEEALESYGIVKTPTSVSVKGNAILWIGNQKLDLSKIRGDISFSSISLPEITRVEITCDRVITIENLTSFHSFNNSDYFVVYLGGFHNNCKRNFLKQLYENNQDKKYAHFGDIDAGGFYIYEHLLSRTGIPFGLFNMDVNTLLKYREAWQELTGNDRKRLQLLRDKSETVSYLEVLNFMLENNCKLEQEAVKPN